jgi:Holliday junction resolvasome RuvABC endonuclease subunit
MLLGLDISSSIIGYTILDKNGELLECECIRLERFKDFFIKVKNVKNKLIELASKYKIEHIYIEESLQAFTMGKSSAMTIQALSKINGTVSWLCYEVFDVTPEYVSSGTARKFCKIKVPKGEKAKPVVLAFVVDSEPKFELEFTAKGNPAPGSFDRADSYVVAKAGSILCQLNKK